MATTDTPGAKVAKKVALVMGEMERIPKRGRNDHFKYDFVTESDVLDSVRKACVKHGLVILPGVVDVQQCNSKTLIRGTFALIDPDSGESLSTAWAGEADDKQDKGLNK